MPPPAQPTQSILIVEDSPEIREVWSRVLTYAGFQVAQAEDGEQGVSAARRNTPDLIVMDLTMPVVDGITAIQMLKADRTTADVPVIVVSGDAMSAGRARAAGCEAFLVKPVRAQQLVTAVVRALESRQPAAAEPRGR